MADAATPDFTPDDLAAAGAVGASPDPGYTWPEAPRTAAALELWMDRKVGVIIHWGIYSAIGKDGSWSLHREHLGEFTDKVDGFEGTDAEYQTWYEDQARAFTGEDFVADEWAQVAEQAGAKYVVFTTKHHDGYAMYDTAYSNFKSTSEASGLKRDVVAEVFDAFRGRDLSTGVYFSKADWNHPDYWDRGRTISDRFHNYDIAEQPAKWDSFVTFTHNQVEELLTRYGKVDLLWLDAGWVKAPDEDIDIDRMARRARELQPDILVVDREVHGPEENYRTPEQQLPDERPDHPWESCITLTRGWCSMRPDEPAKPIDEIVGNLVRIVGRGGNYLIGIGPDATGAMPPEIRERMGELGDVLKVIGDGVYGTRPAPGELELSGSVEAFPLVRADDPSALIALALPDRDTEWPITLRLSGRRMPDGPVRASVLTGSGQAESVTCRRDGDDLVATVPRPDMAYAVAVRFEDALASPPDSRTPTWTT